MSTTNPDLDDCVHCADATKVQMIRPNTSEWQVQCKGCGLRGPRKQTRREAKRHWNRLGYTL